MLFKKLYKPDWILLRYPNLGATHIGDTEGDEMAIKLTLSWVALAIAALHGGCLTDYSPM